MSEQPPEGTLGPPEVVDINEYLGTTAPRDPAVLYSSYRAEKAAQRSVCNVPADDAVWPDDLREALCRRVAHNLAMRGLPLGLQESITDAGAAVTRVGGQDAEVRRLEAPYRKRKLA